MPRRSVKSTSESRTSVVQPAGGQNPRLDSKQLIGFSNQCLQVVFVVVVCNRNNTVKVLPRNVKSKVFGANKTLLQNL